MPCDNHPSPAGEDSAEETGRAVRQFGARPRFSGRFMGGGRKKGAEKAEERQLMG